MLVGATASRPATDLVWIIPGGICGGLDEARGRKVIEFVEKPAEPMAMRLLELGALWNTFVVAGRGRALWRLAAGRGGLKSTRRDAKRLRGQVPWRAAFAWWASRRHCWARGAAGTDFELPLTMKDEGASVLFPAMVRLQVLEQHDGLRDLLRRALAATTQSLRHHGVSRDDLVGFVCELAVRFRNHLAYEERHLVPVLAHVDGWGPERVQDLLEEHTRQRAEVDTLIEGTEGDWDADRIALTLRSLAADLLMDMEEEERGSLRQELLADQFIVVEPDAERPRLVSRPRPAHLFERMTERAAIWVKEMMAELGTDDPHKALGALRAGLHALRDRLTVDEAAQLSAQLPLVVRGLFFENWDPSRTPVRIRHRAEFLSLVREKYGPRADVAADQIVPALFRVLGKHVTAGEIAHIMQNLPEPIVGLADPRAIEHRTDDL